MNKVDNIIKHRRALHKIPEVDLDLPKTREYLLNELSKYNCKVEEDVFSGIVVLIEGKFPGNTVAFRSDMDCNCVLEENTFDWKSQTPGQMHACGHDGHMAMALAVVEHFSAIKDLVGNVKVIFQPGEENVGGAEPMIKLGALTGVDYIFGYHIWPDISEFKFGVGDNVVMSAADAYDITIIGKGGRSGMPERAINPVDVINEIMNRLNLLKKHDCKLVITQLNVGNVSNVIATKGTFTITLRTKDEALRQLLLLEIEKAVKDGCNKFNAKYLLDHARAYPATINNNKVAKVLNKMLDVEDIEYPSMASEDFSFYLNEIPGAFIWLGSKKETNYSLHHPKFDFNEDILSFGVENICKVISKFLEEAKL